jgi:hypothetical protein
LTKKYGDPNLVTRLILNEFIGQKMKLSSIPNIYDICWWLGIKCQKPDSSKVYPVKNYFTSQGEVIESTTKDRFSINKNTSEGDLVWVAAFVLINYGQYLNILEETGRNWEQELEYFRLVLEA